ncbi:MAG: M56 family metallopeptidase [Lachnospiraceae bacterium]|nr:M56 family metallopeptidase [Lachnospiraceae bacterium]
MSTVFLKILNLSYSASWLILAVVIVRLLLKKAPKWINCLLWALVAVRLILPFSLESAMSLLPSKEVLPADIQSTDVPHIESGIYAINNTVNPVIADTFAPAEVSSVNPMQVVVSVLCIVWVAGILAMTLYAFISFVKIKRSVREAAILEKGIMECDEVRSPFILGILRPVIYVPSGMDSETLELVLAHEKAHMKRRDYIWKPLGYALLSVYWFNPLSWIAYILLCRDIESACDEKVIRDKSSDYMAAYSQALLDCSIQRRRIAACPVAFGETGVKMRIKNVLSYKKPAFWIILASLATCVILAVCFLTDPQKDETISEAPAEVETPTVDESDNPDIVKPDDGAESVLGKEPADAAMTEPVEEPADAAMSEPIEETGFDEEGSYDLPDNETDGYTNDYYSEDSSVYIEQDNETEKSMIVDGVKVYPVDIAMGFYGPRVAKFDADGDGVDEYLIAECEGTGTGVSQYGLCIVETDGNSCKLTRYDSQYFADYLNKNIGYQWDDEKQEFNVFTNTSDTANAGSGIHVKPFERHSELEEIVWSDIISIEFEDGHVYLSAPTGYVYKDSPVPDYENAVRVRTEILVQEDSSITLSSKHSFSMDDE